MFAPIKIIVN